VNIVLFEPDIPWNTGNIGRTCLATGSTLHLVGRLGFSLDDKQIRRSGLDYWEKLQCVRHPDWEAFAATLAPGAPLFFFSKSAIQDYWHAAFEPGSYLVFGCETKGLPPAIHDRYARRMYRIPMKDGAVRSLNLSSAVSIALYEALRQTRMESIVAAQ
jgi:tRNA (cytidine/uridine-2'-O-)-methyltransferase